MQVVAEQKRAVQAEKDGPNSTIVQDLMATFQTHKDHEPR